MSVEIIIDIISTTDSLDSHPISILLPDEKLFNARSAANKARFARRSEPDAQR